MMFALASLVLAVSAASQTPDVPGHPGASVSIPGITQAVSEQVATAVHGADRRGKDGPMAVLGPTLATLYYDFQAAQTSGRADPYTAPDPLRGLTRVHNGRVLIDATAKRGAAERLVRQLRRLGLQDGSQFGRVVSGWLPVNRLSDAAALPELLAARGSAAHVHVGSVTSQADVAMRTDIARQNTGLDGTGQTVGVLSDSYDNSTVAATTAAQDIQTGDLPPPNRINVLAERSDPGVDEGRAMMQLIHDIAPGADLAFHRALDGIADFAQGILDLASAGSTVIVDDIIYFAEPMFQDGIVAQAADQVDAQGIPYFSSAGNSARQSLRFRVEREKGL